MNTSDVLYRAADLIEERGWGHGGGWPAAGGDLQPLCLEGGIMAALGQTSIDVLGTRSGYEAFKACPAYRAVNEYVTYRAGDTQLWHWNDELTRTAEQVIATLRAAAVIEAAKETAADLDPSEPEPAAAEAVGA